MQPEQPDAEPHPDALPEAEVRATLNRWSAAAFLRLPQLGDRVRISQILPCFSYSLHLLTQYERRSLSNEETPYRGAPVDSGVPPDPWSVPVRRPTQFEDRTERLPLPHSERVERCGECDGDGEVTCGWCHGSGTVTCSSCSGRGYTEHTEYFTETDGNGNTSNRTETRRDSCGCGNGQVSCARCGHSGRVRCDRCEGEGRLLTFQLLTVEFEKVLDEDVQDTTPVPDPLIGKAHGEMLVDLHLSDRIGAAPPVRPEVDVKALRLLTSACGRDGLILAQRLQIERVGVQEVRYQCLNPKARRLWIFGTEREVHAPGAPIPWDRALVAATPAVVLAGFLAIAAEQTVFRPQPPSEPAAVTAPARPAASDDLQQLRHAVRAAPGDAAAHHALAWAYLRRRDYRHAVYHLKEVQSLAPGTDLAREDHAALTRAQKRLATESR